MSYVGEGCEIFGAEVVETDVVLQRRLLRYCESFMNPTIDQAGYSTLLAIMPVYISSTTMSQYFLDSPVVIPFSGVSLKESACVACRNRVSLFNQGLPPSQ